VTCKNLDKVRYLEINLVILLCSSSQLFWLVTEDDMETIKSSHCNGCICKFPRSEDYVKEKSTRIHIKTLYEMLPPLQMLLTIIYYVYSCNKLWG